MMATVVKNVKVLTDLKFHSDTRLDAECMSGVQLSYQVVDQGFDLGEGLRRSDLVNVRDLPISDPIGPAGKTVTHHGAVFRFVESDDETGFGEIEVVDQFGAEPGERSIHQRGFKSGGRVGRQGVFAEMRSKAAGLGPPLESFECREMIEPGLRVTAPVEISGAEEKHGLRLVHVTTMAESQMKTS